MVERVGYPHRDSFEPAYEALAQGLDSLLSERGIDWSRTVLGGFSQGTVMSYALALGRGRPTPAGVVALSGFIPEVNGWSAELESRRELPVYIHHGANDPVIAVGFAHGARERFEAAGLSPTYRETAAGHGVPPEILGEAAELVAAAVP